MGFRFRSLVWSTQVAQARVYWTEAGATGGLRVEARVARLAAQERGSDWLARRGRWASWFRAAPARVLLETVRLLEERGCGPQAAETSLSCGGARPWAQALAHRVRSGIQRWITA
eukprot:6225509-Lingulodinium_polyedra.AAC.1